MNTVVLPTTLHCAGCVASIKPFFDASKNIKEWKVDLSKPVKTITVTGDEIKNEDVVSLLREAGYDILDEPVGTPQTGVLPPIGSLVAPVSSRSKAFWSDKNIWGRASFNTLNCLIGCSIGDFGTIIVLQAYFPGVSMTSQMLYSTIAGLCTSILLESLILKFRENFDWKNAFQTAFSMSFISMITMEIAMNLSDFMVTGGKAAFNTSAYWLAFAVALVAGFLVPLPYNYFKLKKYNKACH